MAKQIKIPVKGEALLTGDGPINEVILREPTFDEYLDIGEPVTLAKTPDGMLFSVENSEVIRRYLQACLVQPKSALQLNQGGMKLAQAVKGAVLGFFHDAPSGGEPSTTSPTTSSSDAATGGSAPTSSVV